jgi:hypothetical protein
MSLTDLKISNYENDIKKYKEKINNLTNKKGKVLCNNILFQIEEEMQLIQKSHDSRNGGYMDPMFIRENIIRVCQLRLKLDNLIKQSNST